MDNVTRLSHALPMSQDMDPQGLTVGLLNGHAHAKTDEMVTNDH